MAGRPRGPARALLSARPGSAPLLVGQSLELSRPPLADALRRRDPAPLRDRAKRQLAAGAHALDLNLGAGAGAAPTSPTSLAGDLVWAAAAIRDAQPGVALWLDCADAEALTIAVAAVPPPVVANAAFLDGSPRTRGLLAAAAASGAGVVLSPVPHESHEAHEAEPLPLDALLAVAEQARALLAAAGLAEAGRSEVWFDCLAYPAATDAARARRALALVRALAGAGEPADERAPRLRPLLAVGNVGHGAPPQLRPALRRLYAAAASAAGAAALILPVEQPALLEAVALGGGTRAPAGPAAAQQRWLAAAGRALAAGETPPPPPATIGRTHAAFGEALGLILR